jgi:TonB family protein
MAGYLGFTQSFLRCCRLFCRALTLLVCCLAAACIGTQKLPRILAFGADYYPPASARLGEEGRVLLEFQVNETFRPGGVAIREPDPSPRLNEGARRLINTLVFDRSDPIKPKPGITYHATIIFCLQPGHCDRIVPFPNTVIIVVMGVRLRNDPQATD